MISVYCKLTGMPLAISNLFANSSIKAKENYHPVFALNITQLCDMVDSIKAPRYSYDEAFVLASALLKTTDLIKWRCATVPLVEPSERDEQQARRFLLVAKDVALGVAELRRSPKQVAALYSDLPMFYADNETNVSHLMNWAKMVRDKAMLYVDSGRARRQADRSYTMGMYLLQDVAASGRANKATNKEFALPQLYDCDIGLWAFDRFCDEYSTENQQEYAAKFKRVYKLLVDNKLDALKSDELVNLQKILHEVLPLDTPVHERQTQLTLAYLDKVRSHQLEGLAATLGESLATETRTVGDKSWSYVILATGATGGGTGPNGASIAVANGASVKGGGSAASPKGRPLNTTPATANVAPTRPVATPTQLAALRARLQRG